MAFFGGVFLLCYGAKSLWSAFRGKEQLDPSTNGQASLAASLSTCLALTWLNPHVYLDTMVLIGSVSTQYRDHTIAFAAGASAASFVFCFAIGFGARLLPLLLIDRLHDSHRKIGDEVTFRHPSYRDFLRKLWSGELVDEV